MSDQLDADKKYEFQKINDLIFVINTYQKKLANKKIDSSSAEKYRSKLQKCIEKLKKLGINMESPENTDQKGGSTSIRCDSTTMEKMIDDMAYQLCKEQIFMDNICQ